MGQGGQMYVPQQQIIQTTQNSASQIQTAMQGAQHISKLIASNQQALLNSSSSSRSMTPGGTPVVSRSMTPNQTVTGMNPVTVGSSKGQIFGGVQGTQPNMLHVVGNSGQSPQLLQTRNIPFQIANNTPGLNLQTQQQGVLPQGQGQQSVIPGQGQGQIVNTQNTVIQNPNVVNVNFGLQHTMTPNVQQSTHTLIQTIDGKSIIIPSQQLQSQQLNFQNLPQLQTLQQPTAIGQQSQQVLGNNLTIPNLAGNVIRFAPQNNQTVSQQQDVKPPQTQPTHIMGLNAQGQPILIRAPTQVTQQQQQPQQQNIIFRTVNPQTGVVQFQQQPQSSTTPQQIGSTQNSSQVQPHQQILMTANQQQNVPVRVTVSGQQMPQQVRVISQSGLPSSNIPLTFNLNTSVTGSQNNNLQTTVNMDHTHTQGSSSSITSMNMNSNSSTSATVNSILPSSRSVTPNTVHGLLMQQQQQNQSLQGHQNSSQPLLQGFQVPVSQYSSSGQTNTNITTATGTQVTPSITTAAGAGINNVFNSNMQLSNQGPASVQLQQFVNNQNQQMASTKVTTQQVPQTVQQIQITYEAQIQLQQVTQELKKYQSVQNLTNFQKQHQKKLLEKQKQILQQGQIVNPSNKTVTVGNTQTMGQQSNVLNLPAQQYAPMQKHIVLGSTGKIQPLNQQPGIVIKQEPQTMSQIPTPVQILGNVQSGNKITQQRNQMGGMVQSKQGQFHFVDL